MNAPASSPTKRWTSSTRTAANAGVSSCRPSSTPIPHGRSVISRYAAMPDGTGDVPVQRARGQMHALTRDPCSAATSRLRGLDPVSPDDRAAIARSSSHAGPEGAAEESDLCRDFCAETGRGARRHGSPRRTTLGGPCSRIDEVVLLAVRRAPTAGGRRRSSQARRAQVARCRRPAMRRSTPSVPVRKVSAGRYPARAHRSTVSASSTVAPFTTPLRSS